MKSPTAQMPERCLQAYQHPTMQENQDKKIYVTLPDRGDYELQTLLDTINYLRQLTWTYKLWVPTPALIDKSGGSSRQYVGQNFDPKYFDLVEDGWTHDHCEICSRAISNIDGYDDADGYKADNGEWICKDCYDLLIKPVNIQETIKSLKTRANRDAEKSNDAVGPEIVNQ